MTEIERIAASLTEAQQRAVLGATFREQSSVWHPAGYYAVADKRVRWKLALKGLTLDYLHRSNRLTPLGEHVRAHLEGQTHDRN